MAPGLAPSGASAPPTRPPRRKIPSGFPVDGMERREGPGFLGMPPSDHDLGLPHAPSPGGPLKLLHGLTGAHTLGAQAPSGRGLTLRRALVDLRDVALRGVARAPGRGCRVVLSLGEQAVEGLWDGARLEEVVATLLGRLADGQRRPRLEVTVRGSRDHGLLQLAQHAARPGGGVVEALPCAPLPPPLDAAAVRALGLGLVRAWEIVVAHDGELRRGRTPLEETVYWVELPIGVVDGRASVVRRPEQHRQATWAA